MERKSDRAWNEEREDGLHIVENEVASSLSFFKKAVDLFWSISPLPILLVHITEEITNSRHGEVAILFGIVVGKGQKLNTILPTCHSPDSSPFSSYSLANATHLFKIKMQCVWQPSHLLWPYEGWPLCSSVIGGGCGEERKGFISMPPFTMDRIGISLWAPLREVTCKPA